MKMMEKTVKYEIVEAFRQFSKMLCLKWSDKRNSPDTIEVKVALILFIIHRITLALADIDDDASSNWIMCEFSGYIISFIAKMRCSNIFQTDRKAQATNLHNAMVLPFLLRSNKDFRKYF